MADAVQLALARNPALAAISADVQIAEAVKIDAGRWTNPALTVQSEGYPVGMRPRPSFFDTQDLTIRLDQEIQLGSRRELREEEAVTGIDVARARLDDARRLLTLEVQRAYFQAVLATADRAVARSSLEEIDRALSLNQARFKQGEISGGDVRRLQVERLRFVDDVFAAELALRNARSSLLALMNVTELAQEFTVTESLAAGPAAAPSAPDVVSPVLATAIGAQGPRLSSEALARRPDVVAAQREVLRADTETRLQHAIRTPNLTIGGGYLRSFGTNAVVFGATIPLPFLNRNATGVARADAERQQAGSRARATELAARLDIQQAANAVDVNRERVQYIEREYLTTAQQSRDIVMESYRLGAADLIDFLDAQRAYRDTLRTYNRALYDQRISIFELAAATALPPQQQ
jgi:cobalt-zinc-cadmium efflux system outer membrane protein